MNKKSVLWSLTFCLLSSPSFALNYSNPELKFKAKLPDNLDDVSIRVAVRGGLISLGNSINPAADWSRWSRFKTSAGRSGAKIYRKIRTSQPTSRRKKPAGKPLT